MAARENAEARSTKSHGTETQISDLVPETISAETDVERSSVGEKSAETAGKDPNVVDFDGPNDPENPMNWPSAKKTIAIVIVTTMTLLSYVLCAHLSLDSSSN